jgi:hypothetical protein
LQTTQTCMYTRAHTLTPRSTFLMTFHAFYGTCRFITIFRLACHWSLSCAKWIQLTSSQPISLRCILILSSHLHLGFQWYPSFMLYLQNPVCVSTYLPRMSCAPTVPFSSTWSPFNSWHGVQITYLPNFHECSIRSKHLLQHCVHEHPQAIFISHCDSPGSTPI